MKTFSRLSPFNRCPKTGRMTGVKPLPPLLFPLAGFLALLWFLIRVVPKPSRATYPCQRVAAPLAGSFVAWVVGTGGLALALGRVRASVRQARYAVAAVALIAGAACLVWTVLSQPGASLAAPAAYTPHPANAPIGVAKGLAPGRVAWAHDPKVTTWAGSGTSGQRWYEMIDQGEATKLMQWAVLGYTGKATYTEAWDAIFRHFNGGAPYAVGEKVFIKVNFTTSNAPGCADNSYNWTPSGCGASWTSVGQSPQLMIALLDQLVTGAGVSQSNITIGDSTGLWVNELYNPVHTAFPNVKYLDGKGGSGRTLSARSTPGGPGAIYWSTTEANGKKPDYLLQAVVDAKYVIDLAVMKSHERAGVTLTAKNHFGSFSGGNSDTRKPTTTDYYNWHLRLPLETDATAWPDRAKMSQYRPLVDMNVVAGMGGKTILYLLDAIYTGQGWAGIPSKWRVAPFCTSPSCGSGTDAWPSSLFLSMDQVAIDSVGFDLLSLKTDWTDVLKAEGVQDYLHELALANNPPSGTLYDPERDGKPPASQGSHEHWNGASLKQYTRNLGTGAGIDLLYLTADPTAYAPVRRTEQAPAIDGAADVIWSNGPSRTVSNVVVGTISGASDLSASFRSLYDDTNLYVLVDVTDDHLTKDSATWSDDDALTLYLDGDYSRGATYDGANDYELGFRWNDATISRGANSAPVPAGTTFAMAATSGGYRLEVKLPLSAVGLPLGYGRLFGLDVTVTDDDDGGARDAKLGWWAKDETPVTRPDAFGPGQEQGPEKVQAAASLPGSGVQLKWAHFAWNDAYEVHRSPAPYFAPDATTLVTELAAPANGYLDDDAAGTVYYMVRAREGGLGAGANRVGRFEFALVKP